ncbi:MAG TPA: ADP-glyceromanno-heptose 6-epimerase [Bacteroidales bacterium]|nr:ADP-glyceromanno-heptose 6-epimerase [Bacteroidales bacterium]HRZ77059.1 ADP-glyceromanno-heptose 6-epimerase [Bacteroidales bacterium]
MKKEMIVVTGAAGFIGSCLVSGLNHRGFRELVLVDDFSKHQKDVNLQGKAAVLKQERSGFPAWLKEHAEDVALVFHYGARTDTTEFDVRVFEELNLVYSKEVWNLCATHSIPLIYASSAATYGMGEHGYQDDHSLVELLQPLNPYGRSKNDFDRWALQQAAAPPFWAGLKFFNVYGPNEYHKGRMASVIFHAYRQIMEKGRVNLFRSHHPDYHDGEQLRDFVYVKDLVKVSLWLMEYQPASGLYNLGTGQARSFNDLVKATFSAAGVPASIDYIDTPEDIRDKYQYFTEARMEKLREAGYNQPFHSLEQGVVDYVQNYLSKGVYL